MWTRGGALLSLAIGQTRSSTFSWHYLKEGGDDGHLREALQVRTAGPGCNLNFLKGRKHVFFQEVTMRL